MFQTAMGLLQEMAEEQGIDLSAVDTAEAIEVNDRRRKAAREHTLAAAAETYADMARGWLEEAGALLQEKADFFATAVRLDLPGTDPAEQANLLNDALAMVRWYLFQIAIKLMRAVQAREDENEVAVLRQFPKDSDGSAKVALIGIDRSIAAWGTLLQAFPQRETASLEILVHLDRLRRDVEREFPQARAFVRPGFDAPDITALK
jgi:hypothetical protein